MSKTSSQIITCKAAVSWGVGEAVKVEEIQVDPPKSCEVRIKMLCASLCHTDVLCCKGFPVSLFPRVLGHEGVGIVESIGEGVTDLREGDMVVPTYIGECGECDNCKSGKTNICLTYPLLAFSGLMRDGSSRMSINGSGHGTTRQRLYHFLSCSTWSEYTVVDSHYVVKVDPRIAPPHASFISCGFATGFGAVWKEANLQTGSTVAILGLGAVGLGVIEGARMHGAARIIGVDINEMKREKGLTFGMTDFINPKYSNKSISELVMELTAGLGVDYCFECTGVADLINEAIASTKVGVGLAIVLGAGTQKSVEINFLPLLGARGLKYSIFGGIKVQSDLPALVHKCINKEIKKIDELLTHEVQLEDINKALDLMKKPDCIKILINF